MSYRTIVGAATAGIAVTGCNAATRLAQIANAPVWARKLAPVSG